MNAKKKFFTPALCITSERRRWLFSFLYVLAMFIVTYCFVPVHFETNDDSGMAKILSGGITGTPYPKTLFMSTLYGQIVCFLYRILPTVPWYTIVFWVLLFFSLVCIFKSLLKISRYGKLSQKTIVLLITALYVLLFWYYVCFLQFTVVAGVCVSASAILIFARSEQDDSRAARTADAIMTLILLCFGVWIRAASAIMIFPFLFMAVLWQMTDLHNLKNTSLRECVRAAIKNIFTWHSMKQLLTVIAACVVVLGAMNGYEKIYNYQNPEWKEFEVYSQYRGLYTDYPVPSYEEAAEMYDAIGWTPELAKACKTWFMLDERLSLENFRYIQENKEPYLKTVSENSSALPFWVNTLLVQQNGLLGYGTVLILVETIVVMLLHIASGRWIQFLWAGFVGGGAIGIVAILLASGRLPFRVLMCVVIPATLLLVGSTLDCCFTEILHTKIVSLSCSVLCVSTIVLLAFQLGLLAGTGIPIYCILYIVLLLVGMMLDLLPLRFFRNFNCKKIFVLFMPLYVIGIVFCATELGVGISLIEWRAGLEVEEDYEAVEQYIRQNPHSLYIYDTSADLLYADSPLNAVGTRKYYNLMFYGGSLAKSPLFYDQLNALGRTELYAQDFADDGIYFIEDLKHSQTSIFPCHENGEPYSETEQQDFLMDRIYNKTLSMLLRNDYGIENIEIVDTIGDFFCVYRYLPN